MNLKVRISAALATGALVASTFLPALAYADNNITISGNGELSKNTVTMTATNTNTVVQSNDAKVSNTINTTANSGGNTATGNTGGSVGISTGNATVNATVTNLLNSNKVQVGCCGAKNTNVTVSGNGELSNNTATVTQANTNTLFQDNKADVKNTVNANATTGSNAAVSNTGGTTVITTGHATVNAGVNTVANGNVAQIGGAGTGGAGAVNVLVSGNGELSTNGVSLVLANANTIVQDNMAKIENTVNANATSGQNVATGNTGGSTMISTGNAMANVAIDNAVNFNAAASDCGCLATTNASETGNGELSNNSISAVLANTLNLFQGKGIGGGGGNFADLKNNGNVNPTSGSNTAVSNTNSTGGPVLVLTGASTSNALVENAANQNLYVSGVLASLPHVSFDFDFGNLWGFLGN